jgi:electron transport complex protein RnfA
MMQTIAVVLLSTILIDNFVLSRFLGICPFLGVSKKLSPAIGMGIAVTFVMVMASAVTYPLYNYLLVPLKLEYLIIVAFILIIALFVQLLEIIIRKFSRPLYKALGVYLPLITTNCAVLGVALLNISNQYSFVISLVNAFGAGVGFLLAMIIFSGVRERMEGSNIPKAFKGMPITLIAASIVSLSFIGFSGMFEGLFK